MNGKLDALADFPPCELDPYQQNFHASWLIQFVKCAMCGDPCISHTCCQFWVSKSPHHLMNLLTFFIIVVHQFRFSRRPSEIVVMLLEPLG
jgi:hypothetical protein